MAKASKSKSAAQQLSKSTTPQPAPSPSFDASIVDQPIHTVQVEGLVLMKIMKHVHDNTPTFVGGQLLGLDVNGILEVTNCFPTFDREENEDEEEDYLSQYSEDTLKLLREINVDSNTVGLYVSTYMENFYSYETIEAILPFQTSFGSKAVILVYDPSRTVNGGLYLRAFRLSEGFLELLNKPDTDMSREAFVEAGLTARDLFVELPVRLHNNYLAEALVLELGGALQVQSVEMDALTLSSSPFIELHLQSLVESADDLSSENSKFFLYLKNYQKQQTYLQKMRDSGKEDEIANVRPPNKPSRLDAYLIANQLDAYSHNLNAFVQQTAAKLSVADNYHSKKATLQ